MCLSRRQSITNRPEASGRLAPLFAVRAFDAQRTVSAQQARLTGARNGKTASNCDANQIGSSTPCAGALSYA